MMYFKTALLLLTLIVVSCGSSEKNDSSKMPTYTFLALGDSYTIGESVCADCNYPKQLADSLNHGLEKKTSVKIIAKTGWTTTDLLSAIAAENLSKDYDLVTLLIGVNNQYQGLEFSVYEEEFPKLLDMAISFAQGNPKKVMVLSIPNYAFTPFGRDSGKTISIDAELKSYNAFAEKISREKGVQFENITPITEQGLENPVLVASDGLHPSEVAYKKFVEKIYKKASAILH